MLFRNMLKIGSFFLKIGGFVTTIFPPISFALKAAGWMLSLVGNLFQSKEKKKKKAIEHISNSLMKQIEKQKKSFINEYLKVLKNYCDDVSNSTNNYFQMIIERLYLISRQLIKTEEELNSEIKILNYAYAKRIVDWYIEKSQPLTEENISIIVNKVERDFGHKIIIQTQQKLPTNESRATEIKKIIQEDVNFI